MKNNNEKKISCFITMLCGHSFDYNCISNWKDNSCVIC